MDILKELKSGKTLWNTKDGDVFAIFDTGGVGGRYRAVIVTPSYTTMLGDSIGMQDAEGPLTFYNRISPDMERIIREHGGEET